MLIAELNDPCHDLIFYLIKKDEDEIEKMLFNYISNGYLRNAIRGMMKATKARELAYLLCSIKMQTIDDELNEMVNDAVNKTYKRREAYKRGQTNG